MRPGGSGGDDEHAAGAREVWGIDCGPSSGGFEADSGLTRWTGGEGCGLAEALPIASVMLEGRRARVQDRLDALPLGAPRIARVTYI
jgi:hypothetical protein